MKNRSGKRPPLSRRARAKVWVTCGLCLVALTGCHWDMWDQPRYEPLEAGDFFGPGQSASRTLVEGTVPYGGARLDTHMFQGLDADGEFVSTLPKEIQLTRALLLRGQERYTIYCSLCHGATGEGNGMITNRGFPAPPSYHIDRLREAELGYFYDVMTNGFGRMYSYASRIPVDDRWAIAAYVRTLQLSQAATSDTLPADMYESIRELALNPPEPVGHGGHGDGHGDGHAEADSGAHGEDAGGHDEAEHGNEHGSEH